MYAPKGMARLIAQTISAVFGSAGASSRSGLAMAAKIHKILLPRIAKGATSSHAAGSLTMQSTRRRATPLAMAASSPGARAAMTLTATNSATTRMKVATIAAAMGRGAVPARAVTALETAFITSITPHSVRRLATRLLRNVRTGDVAASVASDADHAVEAGQTIFGTTSVTAAEERKTIMCQAAPYRTGSAAIAVALVPAAKMPRNAAIP